jgi:crotonobetainyl-CoA:carnitine CoA-transferase CaiB-like acyl-CoA transferase
MTEERQATHGMDRQALAGLRIIDLATLFAGPFAAMMLGDFGAEVIKIEHPRGDPARGHGPRRDDVPLWWKSLSRNKKTVTLDLGQPAGQRLFRDLVSDADVVIENFRPGTLEKWGLSYDVLSADNPGLVLARVTGFGQFGPSARRPGFGTIAAAMTGFAAMTGEPDGPPTLPPFGLADGVAALTTAFGVLAALRSRDDTGRGQVLDLAIIEPLLSILGPQPIAYDQLGFIPPRTGNRSTNNAPRNTYRTADGKWVAISTSAQNVAERVVKLVGHPEFIDQPWFSSGAERAQHADELDEAVSDWIGRHSRDEVIAEFEAAQAAVAPIYDIADVMRDPQYQALGTITELPDRDLGTVRMQNVLFRLTQTPGRVRWTGPGLGEHNDEIYGALGIDQAGLTELRTQGVI